LDAYLLLFGFNFIYLFEAFESSRDILIDIDFYFPFSYYLGIYDAGKGYYECFGMTFLSFYSFGKMAISELYSHPIFKMIKLLTMRN